MFYTVSIGGEIMANEGFLVDSYKTEKQAPFQK